MLEPGVYLHSVDGIRFSVLLADGATSPVQSPPRSPAELLPAAASIDYTDYRKETHRFYEKHPLFEPKLDIPVAELEDLVGEALMLPSRLSKRDPLNFSLFGHELDLCLQMQDDGMASFLLRAGQAILRTLEMPVLAQIRLRNIFEMAFDGAELTSPSSQKVTRYCDRIIDGRSCKQRGANLMRHEKREQSQVDLIYRRLRDCMYFRMTRYEDASPEQKDRLI